MSAPMGVISKRKQKQHVLITSDCFIQQTLTPIFNRGKQSSRQGISAHIDAKVLVLKMTEKESKKEASTTH